MNCRDCRNHLGGRGTDSVGNAEKAEDLRGLWTLLMLARSPDDDSIAIVILSKIVIMKNHNSAAKQVADETSACAAFLPLPQVSP